MVEQQRKELQQLCLQNEEELNDESVLYYACKYNKTELAQSLFEEINDLLYTILDQLYNEDEEDRPKFVSDLRLPTRWRSSLPTDINLKRFLFSLKHDVFVDICKNGNVVLAHTFLDNFHTLSTICSLAIPSLGFFNYEITLNYHPHDRFSQCIQEDLDNYLAEDDQDEIYCIYSTRSCLHYIGDYYPQLEKGWKLCIKNDNVEILSKLYTTTHLCKWARNASITCCNTSYNKREMCRTFIASFSEHLKINKRRKNITKEYIQLARKNNSVKVLDFFKTKLEENQLDLQKQKMEFEKEQKEKEDFYLELKNDCDNWNNRRNIIMNRNIRRKENGLGN